MAINCVNCGHKMDEYRAISYDIKYLEGHLAHYFDSDIRDLLSNNIKTRTQLAKKKVCIAILYRYSSLKEREIKSRYSVVGDPSGYYHDLKDGDNGDFKILSAQLADGIVENKNSKNFFQ